jgi:glycosyltransferase involved in cell wall biosynthesis
LRVAIAHDYFVNRGGAERTALALQRIWPGAPIFTAVYAPDSTYEHLRALDVRTSFLQKLGASESSFRRYLPLFPRAFRSLRIDGFDVVVASSAGFAHHVRPRGARTVVYCHTPPRFLWDERYRHDDVAPRWARPLLPPTLATLRRADKRAAQRAGVYVANGERTRAQIALFYERTSVVVHPPVECARFRADAARTDEYLMVGRLLPHRNMHLAVEAFTRSGRRLVVVGDGPARASLQASAGKTVRFEGAVPDDALAELYARARGVVVPGEEDFGIVPLEANASGAPVVALGKGGVVETIVDGQTGVLFADESADALEAAVARAETISWDPAKLRAHALRWDEPVFAARMRDIVEG